jgi:hypothetical protein
MGARAALLVALWIELLFHAPSIARGLFARRGEQRREPPGLERSARELAAVHVVSFASLAAVASMVAGVFGGSGVGLLDIVAFASLGLALGVFTAWTEPA